MAMTSTTVRATPNLTVPSTQNTAPVLDFRCLYSYDLRRKAKRWQDGVLRFHTFNNRVMVYDVPRNFIGDTYRRKDEPVQDGDEFELEKGVLIQVGEATGKVDQDLTGLFEKRGKAHIESPAKVVVPQAGLVSTAVSRPAGSATIALSQLRPKTLNSLLGTLKGPLGRAALPTMSPCEQRRGNENRHIERRETKRRRVEAPAEQRQVGSPKIPAGDTACLKVMGERKASEARIYPMNAARRQAPNATPDKSKQVESAVTIALDSEDEQRDTVNFGAQNMTTLAKKRPKATPSEKPLQEKKKLLEKPPRQMRKPPVQSSPATASKTDSSRPFASSKYVSTSSSKPPSSPPPKSTGTANSNHSNSALDEEPERSAQVRLRIASKKPRKKLMYRDLLPQTSSSERGAGKQMGTVCEDKAEDPLNEFHQAEHERLRVRLRRQDDLKAARSGQNLEGEEDPQRPEEPSLFLTQEDEFELLAGGLDISKTPPKASEPQSLKHPERQTCTTSPFLKRTKPPDPRPPDPCFTSTAAAMELFKMDQLLLTRPRPEAVSRPDAPKQIPSAKPLKSPPRKPPFHPPTSITKPAVQVPKSPPSMASHPPQPPPLTNYSLPPSPPPLLPPPPKPRPLKRTLSNPASTQKKPRPLRNTTSDPTVLRTALQTRRTIQPPQLSPVLKEPSPDPWSREAWDLFGCGRDAFAKESEGM